MVRMVLMTLIVLLVGGVLTVPTSALGTVSAPLDTETETTVIQSAVPNGEGTDAATAIGLCIDLGIITIGCDTDEGDEQNEETPTQTPTPEPSPDRPTSTTTKTETQTTIETETPPTTATPTPPATQTQAQTSSAPPPTPTHNQRPIDSPTQPPTAVSTPPPSATAQTHTQTAPATTPKPELERTPDTRSPKHSTSTAESERTSPAETTASAETTTRTAAHARSTETQATVSEPTPSRTPHETGTETQTQTITNASAEGHHPGDATATSNEEIDTDTRTKITEEPTDDDRLVSLMQGSRTSGPPLTLHHRLGLTGLLLVGVVGLSLVIRRSEGLGSPSAVATVRRQARRRYALLARLAALGGRGWWIALRTHRADAHRLLENDTRRAMYELLTDTPGQTLSEIAREMAIDRVTLQHHTLVLVKNGLLDQETTHGRRRYSPANDIPVGVVRQLITVEEHEIRATILTTISETDGPATLTTVAATIDRDNATVAHHLNRLETDGLITREHDGQVTTIALHDDYADILNRFMK